MSEEAEGNHLIDHADAYAVESVEFLSKVIGYWGAGDSMIFKARQQRAGERLVRSLGSTLDYEVWTPMRRDTDRWICLEAQCGDFPGITVLMVPEGNNWELWIGDFAGVQTRKDILAPLSASSRDLFSSVDRLLDWHLHTRSMSDVATLAAGSVLASTRRMFGNVAGSNEAILRFNALALSAAQRAGEDIDADGTIQWSEKLAAEATAAGSTVAQQLLEMVKQFRP